MLKKKGFEFNYRSFTLELFGRAAGLVCLYNNRWVLHLGVRWSHWRWGVCRDWEMGVGAGPLFLFLEDL